MSSAVLEYRNLVHEGFAPAEAAAVDEVADEVRGQAILDLGVGAGRTIAPLQRISTLYTGIDYSEAMVRHCREHFPGVRIEHADARKLIQIESGSISLAMFSCNGISMVDHAGRLAILREVLRVLRPAGVFIFSTCNRNGAMAKGRLEFPEFSLSANPIRLMVRAARFVGHLVFRIVNRARYKSLEVHETEYAIINDRYHHHQTMIYFISVEQQLRQLRNEGFAEDIKVFDLSGKRVTDDTRDDTITFLVRKPTG